MRQEQYMQIYYRRLLIGSGTGVVCFLIGSAVTAFLMTKSDLSVTAITMICFSLTAIAGFLAGFVAKKGNKQKGIVCGFLAAVPPVLLELILFFAFNQFSMKEEVFLLIPVGLLCGMIGGIISSNLR